MVATSCGCNWLEQVRRFDSRSLISLGRHVSAGYAKNLPEQVGEPTTQNVYSGSFIYNRTDVLTLCAILGDNRIKMLHDET